MITGTGWNKFPISFDKPIKEKHAFIFKMDQKIDKQKKPLSIVVEGFRSRCQKSSKQKWLENKIHQPVSTITKGKKKKEIFTEYYR